ncbi:MAG TPA: VOC family protein [Bryobacteraceae bacterium]|nr:VOC family protein [Bryobacteraceae bacterium]
MSPVLENPQIVTAIGQIALTISDLPRAIAFYRDTLGLRFLFETGEMAFFDCGGVRLMLSKAENPGSTYSSILYYKTDDIYKASDQLRLRGVAFESEARMIARMPDHELWMAFFRDSEGNLVGLMSELR